MSIMQRFLFFSFLSLNAQEHEVCGTLGYTQEEREKLLYYGNNNALLKF
jgi:hypothetical protein